MARLVELTDDHLLRYIHIRRLKLIGPIWNDANGLFFYTPVRDELHGRRASEFISRSDLAGLIDETYHKWREDEKRRKAPQATNHKLRRPGVVSGATEKGA